MVEALLRRGAAVAALSYLPLLPAVHEAAADVQTAPSRQLRLHAVVR